MEMRKRVLPIAILLLLSLAAVSVNAEELIYYKSSTVERGQTVELQQDYSVELEWIKNDLDAIGLKVSDGSQRPFAELIMERNEERSLDRAGKEVLNLTLLNISKSEDGDYSAKIELEQYRDPTRPYPDPVMQETNFRVSSDEPQSLAESYAIKVEGEAGSTSITLLRNSIPIERYDVEQGEIVVYGRNVEGEDYTILIGRVSSIFEDTQGNVNVVFSSFNQYKTPEGNSILDEPAAMFTIAMVAVGLLIIAISFVFKGRNA